MKAVIFAGGSGTRLWPVSRKNQPKQILSFFDDETLLEKTYKRLLNILPKQDIFISTNIDYKEYILNQVDLDPDNLILEPELKETSAAIGYAAIKLLKKDPQVIFTNVWSDQIIDDEAQYASFLKTAKELLSINNKQIILAGIKPNYPETGYGYIEKGDFLESKNNFDIFKVKQFKEKPDLNTAKNYIAQGSFYWNPAYFCFSGQGLMDLYKQYIPGMYQGLMRISQALETSQENEVVKNEFNNFEKISIDYSVIEKTNDLTLIPLDLKWADIGHWRTIKEMFSKNQYENLEKGLHVSEQSTGNLIYSDKNKLIATIGLEDMIIVDTDDALLVCPKNRAQDVKKIVTRLKENNDLTKYL